MERRSFVLVAMISVGGLGGACGDSGDGTEPPPEPATGCSPLGADECLTPFPSTFHMVADPSTRTGYRVNLPVDRMPKSQSGVAVRPDRLNQKDGFSPSMPFFVYFDAGVEPTQLPSQHDIGASLTATSTVQLIEYATGARVPLMAELDDNAKVYDRQALIIRPMVRLKPATRYVVALVNLKDRTGSLLAPVPFVALRDGHALNQALEAAKPRYEEIFTVIAQAGVPRASVSLAWDLVTASDETATSHLTHMRDNALAMADAGSLHWSLTAQDLPGDAYRTREVTGTFEAPNYLLDDSGASMMKFGSNGEPAVSGITQVPITIEIPKCAETVGHAIPLVIIGHGLFGTGQDTVRSGKYDRFANDSCVIMVATDWIGLSGNDLTTIGNHVLPDLNNFWIITDRLQQAHVNTQVMARLLKRGIYADPTMKIGGTNVSDGTELYYFGGSLGGIQGGTFMALNPDITRGALNVPGCEWSLMMWRSSNWPTLAAVIDLVYPDTLDRQLLIGSAQVEFDYTDPATFAPHLLANPLPGAVAKKILVQEAIGDSQVPNLATRVLARTMGLQALPLVQPVYGITSVAGPLDSAYTQWDIHATPLPPEDNVAPSRDNGAHGGISDRPELLLQVQKFLRPGGMAEHTCTGPCSFQ